MAQIWGDRRDLNPRQPVPQTGALPTELRSPDFDYILKKNGAGDEGRTRDIQLGRLTLYQLSYSRKFLKWSVQQDLNLRPPAPKAGALPSCAMHRYLNVFTGQIIYYHFYIYLSIFFLLFSAFFLFKPSIASNATCESILALCAAISLLKWNLG